MRKFLPCLLLAFLLLPDFVFAQAAFVRKGFLDLSEWNFKAQGPIALNGEWEFYMSELISAEDFKRKKITPQETIEFPSTWNNQSKTRNPGFGYATYHMKVVVKQGSKLGLELPDLYTNYILWINNERIASNGKVGISEQESIPQYLPKTVPYTATTDTLDVVIQTSNFHHAQGGIREPILLGEWDSLDFKKNIAINTNLAMCAILIVVALVFSVLYFFSKQKSSLLYFSALCITWGIRSVFSNQYLAIHYWPDFPWEIAAKIEYITLFLVMIWAMLFVGSLFRQDSNLIFKYLFCFCNTVFIGLTLFFKASFYTQFLPVYLSFCAILLIYVIYILIRAMIYEREGVWLMTSSTFLGVIIFSYDFIAYQGFATYNPIITTTGYLIMFLMMGGSLMYHLGYLKKSARHSNILTYEDLYGTPKTKK